MLRFASRDNFQPAGGWGFPHHGNRRSSSLQLCHDYNNDDHSADTGVRTGPKTVDK